MNESILSESIYSIYIYRCIWKISNNFFHTHTHSEIAIWVIPIRVYPFFPLQWIGQSHILMNLYQNIFFFDSEEFRLMMCSILYPTRTKFNIYCWNRNSSRWHYLSLGGYQWFSTVFFVYLGSLGYIIPVDIIPLSLLQVANI